jgi:protein phosphatase
MVRGLRAALTQARAATKERLMNPTSTIPDPERQTSAALRQPARLTVDCFGATDQGLRRAGNEDQFVVAALMRALWVRQSSMPHQPVRYGNDCANLFVVADGMGGARAGEQASALAVNAIEDFLLNALHWILTMDGPPEATILGDFKAALRRADAVVCAAAANHPSLRGMGTTVTMAYSIDADLYLAHVGDSRAYLARGQDLYQLTRDHTLVREMVEQGLIPAGDAPNHGLRHVITNAVGGTSAGVRVEVHHVRLHSGDILLLCSDGLTGMVPDNDIARILREHPAPEGACHELINLANANGGEDNVTAILARYVERA